MPSPSYRYLLAVVSCLLAVSQCHGQQVTSTSSIPPSLTIRKYLTTTWDGISPIPPHKLIPLVFSMEAKTKDTVVVNFNSTSFTTDDDRFVTPMVFGLMFGGNDHIHLQVEVQRGGMSQVELYEMGKKLEPKEKLSVEYHIIPTTENYWNGSISIPAEYFPRATNRIAAYANFTKSPNDVLVLSLQKAKGSDFIREKLPNLHKVEFFEDIDMHKYIPLVEFAHWSELWQQLLDVSAGGTHQPSNSTNASKQSSHNEASHTAHSAFAVITAFLFYFFK